MSLSHGIQLCIRSELLSVFHGDQVQWLLFDLQDSFRYGLR